MTQRSVTPKTLEEHRTYLYEMVKLKLWFLWNWLQAHPEEPLEEALRNRVDIYRKTAINDGTVNPRVLHYDDPRWLALEASTRTLWEQTRHDAEATRFEREGFALYQPLVEARVAPGFHERPYVLDYTCGSLKYDAPRPETPTTVGFHIANALQPRSFFEDPHYLAGCLRDLMTQTEQSYGADTLTTHTWLNSCPRWLAYFPEEWRANLGPENTNLVWNYGFWGQFISARGTYNARYGRILRETGRFPYYPRRAQCGFAELRAHLDTLAPE